MLKRCWGTPTHSLINQPDKVRQARLDLGQYGCVCFRIPNFFKGKPTGNLRFAGGGGPVVLTHTQICFIDRHEKTRKCHLKANSSNTQYGRTPTAPNPCLTNERLLPICSKEQLQSERQKTEEQNIDNSKTHTLTQHTTRKPHFLSELVIKSPKLFVYHSNSLP